MWLWVCCCFDCLSAVPGFSECGLSALSRNPRFGSEGTYRNLHWLHWNTESLACIGRHCIRKSICVYGSQTLGTPGSAMRMLREVISACKECALALTAAGMGVFLYTPDAVFLSYA